MYFKFTFENYRAIIITSNHEILFVEGKNISNKLPINDFKIMIICSSYPLVSVAMPLFSDALAKHAH